MTRFVVGVDRGQVTRAVGEFDKIEFKGTGHENLCLYHAIFLLGGYVCKFGRARTV